MSENEERGLQRLNLQNKLPAGFEHLSEEEQRDIMKRLAEQDVAIREDFLRRKVKSESAERDLDMVLDAVEQMDHERRIYSVNKKGETGSGTYDLHIRGGDTRFIVPILIVIGVIILGIVMIFALR